MKLSNIDLTKDSIFIDNFYDRNMSFSLENLEKWIKEMKIQGFETAKIKVDFGYEGEVDGVVIECVSNGG